MIDMLVIRKDKTFVYLSYIFLFFCFFSFVQILPLGTDSQPNAMLVALLLFGIAPVYKINKQFNLLLLLFIVAIVVTVLGVWTFSAFRGLFNYFSLFFLSFISYRVLIRLNGIPYKLYRAPVYIWFVVGLIQISVYPSFLSFLFLRGNSGATLESGRGVVCLTPEPTFYGIMCLLFIMIGYLNFNHIKEQKWLYILLWIQLLIFSRSSTCVFLLAFSFFLFGLYLICVSANVKLIFSMLLVVTIGYFVVPIILDNFTNFRVGILLVKFWENPIDFVILDESINDRFNHVFFPLYGFVTNYGMPHGFDTFGNFMNECLNIMKFQDLFSKTAMSGGYGGRIMSAIGGALFELGIFAFLIIVVIYRAFKPLVRRNKNNVFFLILFIGLLLNAITFSNAIIPFIVGNLFFLGRQASLENKVV